MKIVYVILHYLTENDTQECLESILNTNFSNNYSIVIVDNFSNNGSIENIEKKYNYLDNLFIIKNKKNYGFAKGNNIGYKFAKEHFKPDFIAILNNDILIKDKNFFDNLVDAYQNSNFYIAGPDIVSLIDGKHQSPMEGKEDSIIEINKEIIRYYLLLLCSYLNLYNFIQKMLKRKSKNEKKNVNSKLMRQENIQLHGAFLIFSPLYIQNEDNAFYPGTFLYMEEAILFQYCKNKKYKTLFDPNLQVFHKEDSSTNALFNATKQKREFVFKNMIKSLKIYKKVIINKNKY